QISTAEQLSSYYTAKQDAPNAATWLSHLAELDPGRQRERLGAGLMLIKAERYQDALKQLQGFTDDELATEANYVARVVSKYLELGKPARPEGADKMDDTALQTALEKAAA